MSRLFCGKFATESDVQRLARRQFSGRPVHQDRCFRQPGSELFERGGEPLIVSDFAAAEFASVIARVARMNHIREVEAREIFDAFDLWRSRSTGAEDIVSSDIKDATAIVRRLDLNIRAPDAINLAIARRLGASIATFDRGMAQNARTLGIAVAAT